MKNIIKNKKTQYWSIPKKSGTSPPGILALRCSINIHSAPLGSNPAS